MSKTKDHLVGSSYLAIFIYFILPRAQITTTSNYWTIFFSFRELAVGIITIGMVVVTVQKLTGNKWKTLNLTDMIIWAFVLYSLATLFFIVLPEFL